MDPDPGPILEPKPTSCVAMGGDKTSQPPGKQTSCCFHPDLKKWFPYDTVNGWDLTTECEGAPTGDDAEAEPPQLD